MGSSRGGCAVEACSRLVAASRLRPAPCAPWSFAPLPPPPPPPAGGMHDEALGVLDAGSAAGRLRDPLGVKEQRARLFLAAGRYADAEGAYRQLIAINTENHKYHAGLHAAQQLPPLGVNGSSGSAGAGAAAAAAAAAAGGLSEEQRQRLVEVYGELQAEHPHSTTARRIPLDFLVRSWACGLGRVAVWA